MELQATPSSLSSLSKKEELQAKIKGQNHRATNPKKKKKKIIIVVVVIAKERREKSKTKRGTWWQQRGLYSQHRRREPRRQLGLLEKFMFVSHTRHT